ncbi:MAG: hypothetical protein AAFX55_15255 [Bacteroidota bacterium]
MENKTAIKTLNNLYGLLIEMNYHKEPVDFISDIQKEDPFISKHLQNVLLHRTKTKAIIKERKYIALKEQFNKLKELGLEKLQELFPPKEKVKMARLFRKFEELSEEDIKDINDDQDFLIFISSLKDKLKDSDDPN